MASRADDQRAEPPLGSAPRATRPSPRALAPSLVLVAAAAGACVEADPVVLLSGTLAAPRLPPGAQPLTAPLVELRALGTSGEVVAASAIDVGGAWRLVLPVGRGWRLDVGTTDPRDTITVTDGASGVPLELEVCSAGAEAASLDLFARLLECRDGARCTGARAELAACTGSPQCRDAQAILDRCMIGRAEACVTEERVLLDCRTSGRGETCATEEAALQRCNERNGCDPERSAQVLACEVPCADLRTSEAELCERGGDPCQPAGVAIESSGGALRIGCDDAPSDVPEPEGGR